MAERPGPTRRVVLQLSLGLSTLGIPTMTGCTPSNPTIKGPTAPPATASSPAATPVPTATTPAVPTAPPEATTEQRLARLAAEIGRSQRQQASRAQRDFLEAVAEVHRRHAEALGLTAQSSTRPDLGSASLRQYLIGLARREAAAAIEHRGAALTASGLDARLLGSLAVAANAYASTAADAEPARLRPTERGTPRWCSTSRRSNSW